LYFRFSVTDLQGLNPQQWNAGSLGDVSVTPTCTAGYFLSGGNCLANPMPATDAHWDQLAAQPLTDAAANALTQQGVALPLENPVFNPNSVLEPLTDAYWDPVTETWKKQSAQVTPAADGQTANVQVVEETVDANGDPVEDPDNPGEDLPPEKPEDFCIANPDALACWTEGDPPESDLDTDTQNVTLTADSGWGASGATCPADLTHTLSGGQQIRLKWEPLCQAANTFRPIVIGMAWLSAIIIFMGISRRAT
jgi:hypothetical protein